MSIYRVTAPSVEPVTLDEVKAHIRQDASVGSAEDAMLTRWIKSARERAEHLTQRAFVTQVWAQKLDMFPAAIELPVSPIIGVDHVKYYDDLNALQTLDPGDYKVDDKRPIGYIVPAYGLAWPTTYPDINAVEVQWQCGYGASASAVPECVKDWMLLIIEDRYSNRGANYPVNAELRPHPQLDSILAPVTLYRV